MRFIQCHMKHTHYFAEEEYNAPSCKVIDVACSTMLCNSPQFRQEEFGGFTSYDGWDS